MTDLIISAVPATMIELVWENSMPILQRAADKAPLDVCLEAVKTRLKSGTNLLVIISDGAEIIAVNVLDVITLDTGNKVLYIPITAGDRMAEWLDDFLKVAEAIAKDYHCVELRGMAVRPGWLRKLKSYGWDTLFTTIYREIGE